MRKFVLAATLLLGACGQAGQTSAPEKLNAYDVEEPAPDGQARQIAYTYAYAYTLEPARIADAQRRHSALCRSLRSRCLIVEERTSSDTDDAAAMTRLIVDARLAAVFGQRLDAAVAEAGGERASRTVVAEDVTKQLVDTDARVRAKQVLAARLLALIGTAKGNVADLVAAEKAYADVQEELDAARTLAATLRQRVAMSELTINYGSEGQAGVLQPVRQAFAEAGRNFASSFAASVTFVIALIPWLLLGAPLLLGLRALWRRRRGRAQ